MEPSNPSRTRRSYPNLYNLTLAPLSTKYSPTTTSQPPSPSNQAPTPRSYMVQKSAPSTPGILTLSASRPSSPSGRRRQKRTAYAYDGFFLPADAAHRDVGDIPKSKSTSAMGHGVTFAEQRSHNLRKGTPAAPVELRVPSSKHHTRESSDDWYYRAGLAIASETRESKGQGWLVRRDSSTSLIMQQPEADGYEERVGDINVQHSASTPRFSRPGSRINSRVGSRVSSRRASRVGSKVDLVMTEGAKHGSARPSLELDDTMFEDGPIEPDFINPSEESSGDEEEIARLALERGFGLGGWMDRLIGWTLFSVDEDGENSSDEEEDDGEDEDDEVAFRPENMTKEELQLRREVEAKRRKLEREAIVAAAAVMPGGEDARTREEAEGSVLKEISEEGEEGGGWQDAAWLFSVASKVIL